MGLFDHVPWLTVSVWPWRSFPVSMLGLPPIVGAAVFAGQPFPDFGVPMILRIFSRPSLPSGLLRVTS